MRKGLLNIVGLEVCVGNLEGYAARKSVIAAKLEGDFFGHSGQFGIQEDEIYHVLLESVLNADTFLFVEGDYGGFVNAVGLAVEVSTRSTQEADHQFHENYFQSFYHGYTHFKEQDLGFVFHTGKFGEVIINYL